MLCWNCICVFCRNTIIFFIFEERKGIVSGQRNFILLSLFKFRVIIKKMGLFFYFKMSRIETGQYWGWCNKELRNCTQQQQRNFHWKDEGWRSWHRGGRPHILYLPALFGHRRRQLCRGLVERRPHLTFNCIVGPNHSQCVAINYAFEAVVGVLMHHQLLMHVWRVLLIFLKYIS